MPSEIPKIPHAFVADPFGRNQCDWKGDVDGRRQLCGEKRERHASPRQQEERSVFDTMYSRSLIEGSLNTGKAAALPAEPWKSPRLGFTLCELLKEASPRVSGPFLSEDLRAAAEHFKAHPPASEEWICEQCRTVYPGPPQPGLKCVICPKCGGPTGTLASVELRLARDDAERLTKKLKDAEYRVRVVEGANAQLGRLVSEKDKDRLAERARAECAESVAAAAAAYLTAHDGLVAASTGPGRPDAARNLGDAWVALNQAVAERRKSLTPPKES